MFGDAGGDLKMLYDVAHNIAKVETHQIDGAPQKVIMHRKGATRAFGPGHPEVIGQYRAVGQPVLRSPTVEAASLVSIPFHLNCSHIVSGCCWSR